MPNPHEAYAYEVHETLAHDLPLAPRTDVYLDLWMEESSRDDLKDVAVAVWRWDEPQPWMYDRYAHGLMLTWTSEEGWHAGPLQSPSGGADRLDPLPVPHYAAPAAVAAALATMAAGKEMKNSEAVWPGASDLQAALTAAGAVAGPDDPRPTA